MTRDRAWRMDEMSGWGWLPRILGFVVLFLGLLRVSFGLLTFAGVSFAGGLEARSVFPLVLSALLASWVLQVKVSGRAFTSLGLPGGLPALRQTLAGGALGVALIGAVVLVLAAVGWVSWSGDPTPGSPALAALTLAGVLLPAAFVEELLFRGYPFQVMEARFGAGTALATTSVAFGAIHYWNPNVAALPLINIALAGAVLGVAYWRTRSLWFATGVHLGWNWVMAVSELSVSGIEFDMPGIKPTLTGPEIWTGGAFGPEGGLLVSIVSVVGVAWMWRSSPKDESLSRQTDPDMEGGPGETRE